MATLLRNTCLAVLLALAAGTAAGKDGDLLDRMVQARQAYSEGKWDEAGRLYLALTEAVPGNAEVWFRLGNVYVRQDRLDEALAAFGEALRHDPDLAKGWYNLAIVHMRLAMEALQAAERNGGPGAGATPPERLQAILEAALGGRSAAAMPGTERPLAPPADPASATAK